MSTTTIIFNNITEREELTIALKSQDLVSAVAEFRDWMRTEYKYNNVVSIDLETVRQKFYKILDEHNVGELF